MERKPEHIIVVVTTCERRDDAEKIGSMAVEKKLAACAQISGPITSHYWWQGRQERAEEWQIRMKTTHSGYKRLENFIRENHPYELPQIVAFEVDRALPEFALWVAEITEGK
jgi:periplasmic divalent cation tolerance protein